MPTLSISLNNSFPALMIVLPEVLTQQSSPPSTLLGHAEPGMSCQSLFSNITSWICVVVESHIHPHLKITYNGTRIEFKKKKKKKLQCMGFVPENTELTCDFQLGNRGKNTETQ